MDTLRRIVTSSRYLLARSVALIVLILMTLASKQAEAFTHWATVTPASGWRFVAADFAGKKNEDAGFAGDGKSDVVGYQPATGTLHVGINTESYDSCGRDGPCFTFSRWGNAPGSSSRFSDWRFLAGDFAGDRNIDVLGYNRHYGELHIGVNTDRCERMRRCFVFVGRKPRLTGDWHFVAGDFTGTTKTDLMGYTPHNGKLQVGTNTGDGFTFSDWATVTPRSDWSFIAGDFNGDGKTDVMGYHPSNGTLRVGINTDRCEHGRPCFTFSEWATVPEHRDEHWQFVVSRRLGGNDTTNDVVAYNPRSGNLFFLTSLGSGFAIAGPWSTVPGSHRSGWRFVAGEFLGNEISDVMAYNPHNGYLRVGNSRQPIEGYAWPLSAAPGDKINFFVSGWARAGMGAQFYRYTADAAGLNGSHLDGMGLHSSKVQFTNAQPWRNGAGWEKTFTYTIPRHFESGIYAAYVGTAGNHTYITFIVKPAPERRSRLAVIANVNTWLAYNRWGGRGKYRHSAAEVSFRRPNPAASPVTPRDDANDQTSICSKVLGTSRCHLTRGELWILGWLEETSQRYRELAEYRPDVYPDTDLHDGDGLPRRYKTLVLSTHPEYWTVRMYDNLKRFLDRGGSIVYLGGNGIFERANYTDNKRRMSFREGGGARQRAMFRMLRLDAPRHERALLGVATERCSVQGAGYEVLEPEHPVISRGTVLRRGSVIGEQGLNTGFGNGAAAAWEVDTSQGAGATGIPRDCACEGQGISRCKTQCENEPESERDECEAWCERQCERAWAEELPAPTGPPNRVTVLARAQNWRESDDDEWKGAEMVYFERNGGGIVFSVGSITFGGSLVADATLQQIVRNVLREAAGR